MVKLLEPSLQIQCREEDKDDIEGCLSDLSDRYNKYMKDETDRDDYTCTLSVIEGAYLTDAKDKGCGGVILYTLGQRIVCPNMLYSRLELALEEGLP
jgi:hypothetical protein